MQQLDYRATPSAGGSDMGDTHLDGYDGPIEPGAVIQAPQRDLTFKWYDTHEDASTTALRAPAFDVTVKGNPESDAVGYSPDLAAALAFERSGPDGSPPPW